MRTIIISLLVAACGGPSQQQLAATPIAQTPRSPAIAPPASDSDEDRHQLVRQFDDQRDAQQAYREATPENPPAPLPPLRSNNPPGEVPPPPAAVDPGGDDEG